MLIQFSVENFMSFKEKTVFSMKPGTGNELPNHVYSDGKNESLRTIAIYGANASGKTNFIRAFTAMIMILRESNNLQLNQPLYQIIPFKLDKKMLKRPTAFEIIFIADGKKYIYGFSATVEKIIDEYLYVYNTVKKSLIFERNNSEDFYFPKTETKRLQDIETRNTPNKLFLSTATNWNYEHTKTPFTWLTEVMDTYDTSSWPFLNHDLLSGEKSNEFKLFINNFLHMADINIINYEIYEREVRNEEIKQLKKIIPKNIYAELVKTQQTGMQFKSYDLMTMHIVENDGIEENYQLDFNEESNGTKIFFSMAIAIKQAFDNGKTMIIDEIESSIHPLLVESIIEMFNDPTINVKNAQLIFTTHDINLLTIEKLRRDQIYFCEKNNKTAGSYIFSLDEFSVRKDEKIRKNYINGRYGAIPIINRGVNIWELQEKV